MSRASKTFEQILDAVDYQVDRLPHPIDLLSADLIADVSGVPKTTLLSATSSVEALRLDVLAAAVTRLGMVPGEATWAAMRSSLSATRSGHGVAVVLQARSDELASDPAFPYFLSAFDRLSSPEVAAAVATVCSQLVDELAPFIDTVLHATGEDGRVQTHLSRMSMLSSIMALALQRLIGGGADFPTAEARAQVAANAGFGLVSDVRAGATDETERSPFLPVAADWRTNEGALRQAVDAATDVMLSGGVPLRFGMKLDDVLKASGVSSATFYRRFGSMAGFERKLVERTGRDLVLGYRDDFFAGVLASIADGSMSVATAIGELQRRATNLMDLHVRTKRPGTEVLPWMATEVGTQVFAPAFREVSEERGDFFLSFAEGLGLPFGDDLDAPAVGSTLHVYSWVAEMLTRQAPDREVTAAFMHERSALIQRFVFGAT